MPPALSSQASDPGGIFLVLALVLPVTGILLAFLAGGRHARGITLVLLPGGTWRSRRPLSSVSGGAVMR